MAKKQKSLRFTKTPLAKKVSVSAKALSQNRKRLGKSVEKAALSGKIAVSGSGQNVLKGGKALAKAVKKGRKSGSTIKKSSGAKLKKDRKGLKKEALLRKTAKKVKQPKALTKAVRTASLVSSGKRVGGYGIKAASLAKTALKAFHADSDD